MNKTNVVIGLGEVGKPLLKLISKHQDAVGVDITPANRRVAEVGILHVCYPFEINDFIGETVRYIEFFKPELTVINSTVAVGTTRRVSERSSVAVVNSPIRGKHARMFEELTKYVKFIGAIEPAAGQVAAEHFQSLGLKTRIVSSPEVTELAKLTETTYFGLMIAWAQEIERYCDLSGADYDEVVSFYEEVKFFPPVKYTPGVIGGHCVMPNIELLSKFDKSLLLKAVQVSNDRKIEREARSQGASERVHSVEATEERYTDSLAPRQL